MPDSGGGRGWKHPWWEGRVHAMGQKILLSEGIDLQSVVKSPGGEGGIRTPDTVARMPHFECGAFNHSATSPGLKVGG